MSKQELEKRIQEYLGGKKLKTTEVQQLVLDMSHALSSAASTLPDETEEADLGPVRFEKTKQNAWYISAQTTLTRSEARSLAVKILSLTSEK